MIFLCVNVFYSIKWISLLILPLNPSKNVVYRWTIHHGRSSWRDASAFCKMSTLDDEVLDTLTKESPVTPSKMILSMDELSTREKALNWLISLSQGYMLGMNVWYIYKGLPLDSFENDALHGWTIYHGENPYEACQPLVRMSASNVEVRDTSTRGYLWFL